MIALVDCNNFYASCERVFTPKLANKPVIVLSNNDGCVIARSNEVKALGVKMGEPAFKLKDRIAQHNINVFSTNFALYGDLSNRVMTVLKTEVSKMEVYSIDEAFLDFSDYADVPRGVAIKKKVQQWTGIPVSVGIAPNKVLAKIASHVAKKYTKSGVFFFDTDELITRALKVFPVEDLWGIGRKHSKRLKDSGIHTAIQLRDADTNWVKSQLSINGVRLQKELKGEVCFPLTLTTKRKQNICTARSFGNEINTLSGLKEAVSAHANTCATKLRKEKSCCTTISVFINTNRFKPNAKQYNPYKTILLDTPTNDSMEIVKIAIKALESIYHSDCIYKKAGVIVGKTVPQEQLQLSMFDTVDRGKRKDLNKALDKINILMGKNKVQFAVQGSGRKWKLKQEKLSPCYTTQFSDILEVKV
jgi:DNA polymerase V